MIETTFHGKCYTFGGRLLESVKVKNSIKYVRGFLSIFRIANEGFRYHTVLENVSKSVSKYALVQNH